MKKPENWDETQEAAPGERRAEPEPGAYVCRIVEAVETQSKAGRNMLKLNLDIAEGEYANFYSDDYQYWQDGGFDAYWKLTLYQLTEGASTRHLKYLVRRIEESNPKYKFNFDEKTLVGKLIGVMLDGEEFKNQNGIKLMRLKAGKVYSAQKVRSGLKERPRIAKLDPEPTVDENGLESVDDVDIPF